GSAKEPGFLHAVSLYHPETVIRSLRHDGTGPEPGIKDDEGKWDLRPHSARIMVVDDRVLQSWAELVEGDRTVGRRTRMVYTVNRSVSDVLTKLTNAPQVGDLKPRFSHGWHESID